MNAIQHRIEIDSPQKAVFQAISTIDGLSAWWTQTTSGESTLGNEIDFRFGEHVTSFKVTAIEPASRVGWECVRSAPDWLGTNVTFALTESEGKTSVNFAHSDWREANDFFGHCSMKWAVFLLSLKQYVETGEGQPFPNDVSV